MSNSFTTQWDQLKAEWEALSLEDQISVSFGFEKAHEADQSAGYELAEELDVLRAEWAAMSAKRRTKAWDRYTREIDEGGAGWNRFHPILWPAYETGAPVI